MFQPLLQVFDWDGVLYNEAGYQLPGRDATGLASLLGTFSPDNMQVFPAAVKCLEELLSRGYMIGLCSNRRLGTVPGDQFLFCLEEDNMDRYFHIYSLCHEDCDPSDYCKTPRLQWMLSEAKKCHPEIKDLILYDDVPEHVEAAVQAGLRAVRINPLMGLQRFNLQWS